MKHLILGCFIVSLFLFFRLDANAGNGFIEFPDNGHFYKSSNDCGTWEESRFLAAAFDFMDLQCHLATITSQAENDFIENQIFAVNAFIGGFQGPGASEPGGDFEWVTGETFSYTMWGSSQPDDFQGVEDCIEFRLDGTWNDQDCANFRGCIIECEAPPPSGPIVIIPTMGQWGMIIATILLGFFAVFALRKRIKS